jgi:DUF1680 family protein
MSPAVGVFNDERRSAQSSKSRRLEMPETVVSNISPRDIAAVGGFLGQRFHANRVGRLKDWMLSEEFVRLYERQDHDGWFWLGEQVGKWLDASAYTALITDDQELLKRVDKVIERLSRAQEEDGYLGVTRRRYRIPVRGMQLYEWYYVLHGLLVCADLLDSEVALETARRLGDYIIRTWGPDPGQFPLAGRFPGNGHGGGEGTLILEPIVLLGQRTGDARYVEWGERTLSKWDEWLAAYSESRFTCDYTSMRQFAAGEKDVYELRENIHAHTFHMTLLGIAALHNATGNAEYRDIVMGSIDRLAEEWIFLTGGMSSGERYLPRRFYHPRGDIEVCPQHTWILLLDQALRWTGKARYAAEIERDSFNHFLAAQLADGSNWSYMTPLNGRAQEPKSPNCCNAAGHRLAGRMPTYLYGLRDGAPAVLFYSESAATLRVPELPAVTLQQETDFPSNGAVTLYVQPERPAAFPLHLRIPPYAQGATVQVGDEGSLAAQAGDFLIIEREWKPGDVVKLSLPFPLTCQANGHMTALVRGPLVYAYFQDAQADPVVLRRHRGRFPEDGVLVIDPDQPGSGVQEEPAQDGLLGPALRVPGYIQSRAPIFAAPQANSELPGRQKQALLLLPFVNQGAIRGEYRVFMEYVKSAT